jgi:predicted metal-binding membrane protein
MALLFAMWSAMMVGMMLPSALPAVVDFGRTVGAAPVARVAPMHLFAAGYVLVWVGFSLAATLAQLLMYEVDLLTPMMEPATPVFAASLLLAAGLYQLLPFKRRFLASCCGTHGPAARRRDWSLAEAWMAGVHCGGACLASNGLLMLLLFAGGVMRLRVIVALTGLVLLEKLTPLGVRSTWISGALLVGLALWVLVR